MENKNTHGGQRKGAGRKPKPKRTVISFAIPEERKSELQAKYPKMLNKMFDEWQKTL